MKTRTTVLSVLATVALAATPALASEVAVNGTWYNFKTQQGVDFGAGVGFAYNHTSAVPSYYDPGAPPWTFNAPSGGARITVLDGGEIGDVYDVYDSGNLIGTTSTATPAPRSCGDFPEPCLNDPAVSKGTFNVSAGPHSITIRVKSTPYPNSFQSWFRVEAGAASSNPPVISAVLSAAGGADSVQRNIEAGSWVAIYGTDLADTTADWSGSIVNGRLPTTLGGVSVTINGQPAYVYFISPNQVNVQAPEAGAGTVQVVVTTRVGASAPATAEMSSHAPAFFQWGSSKYAVATRFPDNAFIGNPNIGAGFTGAAPGSVVTLWATGFGPAVPNVTPGVLVTGAPVTADMPTVTVGGQAATVIGAAVSPGFVGLYQIAIQLPGNLAAGDAVVRANVGGFSSPDNVYLYISQ